MIRWYVQGLAWTLTFYPTGNPGDDAARRIAAAFNVSNVTLWPTEESRIFRATWFNPATEVFFEGHVRLYPHG